jgi:Ca2+-binding EF-hand superfamily protein
LCKSTKEFNLQVDKDFRHIDKEISMSTSISSISGSQGAAGSANFDPSKMASKIASKMMSDLDSNKDGTISKDEFASGMTSKGMSSADAEKMYDAIDTKKTGSITKSDIENAVKNGDIKPPSGGGRPPPSGGSGKPGGAGGAGGSSDSKTYDPADTNKDGKVSAEEALIYSLKHPSVSNTETTNSSQLGQNVDQNV